ncbi:MAG: hypothetical protein ABWZ01_00090 [Methyloceanibacter sp.]
MARAKAAVKKAAKKPASKTKAEEGLPEVVSVVVTRPNMVTTRFKIVGTSPYMHARLSAKTRDELLKKFTHDEQRSASKKARKARNLKADYEGAIHRSKEGWPGIPASAFRTGMISACRLVGFKMTFAKLSVFVPAQGFDKEDGLPLIRIHGAHESNIMAVRNTTGVIDLRVRPLWEPGWWAELDVRFDADQFKEEDVFNLLLRVGEQVGIGEGRADSRNSAGIGFGSFTVEAIGRP